uniref:Uncharacterized protein n=2 Tax=Solanum lycopersicum TaxID=4081 RepID=A0A3Q7H6B5_SOLLC
MSHGDTIPLHSSYQSDIDKIENLIYSNPSIVLPARPPSPRGAIPVPAISSPQPLPSSVQSNIAATGFGSPPNTLIEPVWDTVKRDLPRIVSNLKLVVFPNPYREDPGKALRD